jgi:hypothetical protein
MTRILAISPSSRGFGFAVLEDQATLVDWGVKSVKGDKNVACLKQTDAMCVLYHPALLVLEDASAKGSKRAPRIRKLIPQLVKLAKDRKIRTKVLPRRKVREFFFGVDAVTKFDLAVFLSERFPEELASKLPPERKPWMSEDARLDIFEAVALALVGQKQM